jgi:hypothetical protein
MNPKKSKNISHNKTGVVHRRVRYGIGNHFESICGVAYGSAFFYNETKRPVTCKKCLKSIEKTDLITKRKKLNVKEHRVVTKTYKTSDCAIFYDEDEAFAHEEHLESGKPKNVFERFIRNEIPELIRSSETLWSLFSNHGKDITKAREVFDEIKRGNFS